LVVILLTDIQVASERFIDEVPMLVIDSIIVKKIMDLFQPIQILKMQKDVVNQIAGESTSKQQNRQDLSEELSILTSAEAACKRYAKKSNDQSEGKILVVSIRNIY
jgi:ribosomal protein L5